MSVGNFFFPTKFWNWRKLKSIWWQWSRRWGSKFAIIDHGSYYNVDIFGWQLLRLDDLCNIWCFWAWGMQLKFDPKLRNNGFFLLHFLCWKGKWWKERRGKKRGTIHALKPPVWWPHPPWIRPWAPSFFTSTLFTDANLISLSLSPTLHYFSVLFFFVSAFGTP